MKQLLPVTVAVMLLAGCGSTDKDRAISGGGIGAGVGAVTGLVIGGAFPGLVIGGAFGAATGLVTDRDMIDLGEPIWAGTARTDEVDTARRQAERNDGPTPFNDDFTVLD